MIITQVSFKSKGVFQVLVERQYGCRLFGCERIIVVCPRHFAEVALIGFPVGSRHMGANIYLPKVYPVVDAKIGTVLRGAPPRKTPAPNFPPTPAVALPLQKKIPAGLHFF